MRVEAARAKRKAKKVQNTSVQKSVASKILMMLLMAIQKPKATEQIGSSIFFIASATCVMTKTIGQEGTRKNFVVVAT